MSDLRTLLLSAAPGLKISENVSYREITTIGVGSALPLLADVGSEEELVKVLRALKKDTFPFFILGAGSNLIGMDAPYPGVGIRLSSSAFGTAEFSGTRMRCGAALRLPRAARCAADHAV